MHNASITCHLQTRCTPPDTAVVLAAAPQSATQGEHSVAGMIIFLTTAIRAVSLNQASRQARPVT
jgi:hypothetical protein